MEKKTIVWIYSQWKWNFGFVDVEWEKKWYFVHGKNKNNVLPWDKVEALVQVFRWREEALVTRALERKDALIVWEYQISLSGGRKNSFGFVVPQNPDVRNDIFVSSKNSLWAESGDIVWVKIIDWKKKDPEGRVVEKLWRKWDVWIDVMSLLLEGGARLKFGENIEKSLWGIHTRIDSMEWKKRTKFTRLFTFTIDGEDAKDLDDAISVKKKENGDYKLYVHIADVSHYVSEGVELDKEAYRRATSIYVADRVVPMLPEKLSNDLCSLNADREKLTLTCEMIISESGELKKTIMHESIIKSDFRLTYKEVDEIIEWKIWVWDVLLFWWKTTGELIENLRVADTLKNNISDFREKSGALNFDFSETKIVFDKDGKVVWIKESPKYDSNNMIEKFMVSANEAVSRKFSTFPFLYRIHEEPKDEDITKLQDILNLFEVKHIFRSMDTKDFGKLLCTIWGLDEQKKMFLEKMVLRTLSKAIYSDVNMWHFGLWLQFYSHFTSPIRRYPDLQIHRIIKEKLQWKLIPERIGHYKNILEGVAHHASTKEREAEKLEYRVRDYFVVQFYKDKVWEEFDGVITTVLNAWFFVGLPDTTEGFVELDNVDFDESLQELRCLSTWKRYRLWDGVRVRLVEADEVRLRLNFELV
jgi:ribonuclease R